MPDSLEFFIQRYALWYVTKYSTCSYRLEKAILRRLRKKELLSAETLPIVQKTIQSCERNGYFDDALYMRQQIQKWQKRGYHYPVVFAKLLAIGYDRDAIHAILQEYDTENPTPENEQALLNLLKRKGLTHHPEWDRETIQKMKRRILGMLSRRGYTYETALSVIRKMGYTVE